MSCIPSTNTLRHVVACVNAGAKGWGGDTSVTLQGGGGKQQPNAEGPRTWAQRPTDTPEEEERKVLWGHGTRIFTSLCTKFNYQDPKSSTHHVVIVAIIEYPNRKWLSASHVL